jgi:uncharacterized membrane protein
MSEQDPVSPEILERLARLEAQVKWLTDQVRPPAAPDPSRRTAPMPAPPPRPLRPQPRPAPAPGKPVNPIVWVASAGSAIFLIGAAFFLHWSIQRGWIGPELRFLLGLVAGGALSFGAGRLILGHSPKLGVALLLAGLGTLTFTFRWGAFEYHFFAPALGFAATFLCTLVAGGLGARAKSGGALTIALITGLLAPLVFSEGGHHEVALAVYLAALMAAALAVPYLAKTGARWGISRWLAVIGTWLLVAVACAEVPQADAASLFGLLLLHYLLAGLWIWLPGQGEDRPSTPTILWLLVSLGATSLAWVLWKRLGWAEEWFAVPVVVIAAINLALVKPLRVRLDGRQADFGLLALAAGHLALAVPVALAWRWVGPVWGLFALFLAWGAGEAETRGELDREEVLALTWMALAMAGAATLRWLVHGAEVWGFDYAYGYPALTPFLNSRFAEGLVTAAAWGLLARRNGFVRPLGIIGLEVVGGLTLSLELAHLVRWGGGSHRSASVVLTLGWAVAGALQWLKSLSVEAKTLRTALAVAGYTWLGIASLKLITVDLEHADTPMKALAFLGVGAVVLAAALVGNRVRLARKEEE